MTPLALAATLFALPMARELRLIGGLGVRVLSGNKARVTLDVDLVVSTSAAAGSLRAHLEADGWKVGDAGAYFRARKAGEPAIDVFVDPVTNPRTFESTRLSQPPVERVVDGARYVVAAPHDIAFLKLCAGRDQDAIDVAILAAAEPLVASSLVAIAEANDLEIRLAEGAQRFRNLVQRAAIETVAAELLGRPFGADERESLARLLAQLQVEGT
ncbi:MAG: hypothetical protein IPG50_29955 [Myxococcales bacterium]|nr:hypothetical protein [Myxococcales bacterium]